MPAFTVPLQEFNDCHVPAGSPQGGQFCAKTGASTNNTRREAPPAGSTYARPTVHRVQTLEEAVRRILKGEVVELADVRTVNTVLSTLAAMAKDAEAKGEKAPHYDLCNVTVPGTNLFCGHKLRTERYPNGIPRIEMPQFVGSAVPGSPADRLPKDEEGGVDGAPAFIDHLADLGIQTTRTRVPAASLKASQSELIGPKVAGMMAAKTTAQLTKTAIFVSRDNYVIDGHHRWAAIVGRDSEDGRLDVEMPVIRVDAPIAEILHLATRWTRTFGIQSKAGK